MTGEPNIAFVDTETTGLHPYDHEIWEVGLIVDDVEHHWFLPVNLSKADPFALNIGGYHNRHPRGLHCAGGETGGVTDTDLFCRQFAKLTWGRHLVGAVVSFDEERLRRLLRRHGQAEGWHYHLVDVEALAVGYLAGRAGLCEDGCCDLVRPPYKSDQLTEALGIEVDDMDKHTALGDARWAKAIYEKVMG